MLGRECKEALAGVGLDVPFVPNRWQAQAYEALAVGRNLVASFPTGGGKTLCAMMGFALARSRGQKSLFLVPLKALAANHRDALSAAGFSAAVSTGDEDSGMGGTLDDVVVTTYEKLDSMLFKGGAREEFLSNFGCVAIDEVHLVGDPDRGANLESAVMTLMRLDPSGETQLIGLSATVSNPGVIAEWLGGECVEMPASERPVKLEASAEGYPRNKTHAELMAGEKGRALMRWLGEMTRESPQARALVFVSSRARAEDLCKIVLRGLGPGTADYHHAGRSKVDRASVEQRFDDPGDDLRVITCTPTLAQGVNLGADYVVLYDCYRWSGLESAEVRIPNNELIQMGGRAGRRGKSALGVAQLKMLCKAGDEREILNAIVSPTPVVSRLKSMLREKLLRFVGAGLVRNFAGAKLMLRHALPSGDPISDVDVADAMGDLLEYKMITNNSGKFGVTHFGETVARFYISVDTALHIVRSRKRLAAAPDIAHSFSALLDCEEFMSCVSWRSQDGANLVFDYSGRGAEHADVQSAVGEMMGKDPRLCKAFAIIYSGEVLVERPWVSASEVAQVQRAAGRMIGAAKRIFWKSPVRDACETLQASVFAQTLNARDVRFLAIPGLGGKTLQAVRLAGYDEPSDLLRDSPEEVRRKIKATGVLRRVPSVSRIEGFQDAAKGR